MIVGVYGKGGSGKSSVATQLVLDRMKAGASVLAIDADHNMDLAHNLTDGDISSELSFLGSSLEAVLEAGGGSSDTHYSDLFVNDIATKFSLNPVDLYTKDHSVGLNKKLRLMVAGPQTDNVLYGTHCSHSLTTPLKVYLPLLQLQENETVIMDEKAGADGVTTGITTGIDVGVIVCEPALHSVKTALQIAELMEFYNTPYLFIANKVSNEDEKEYLKVELGDSPIVHLTESGVVKRQPGELVDEWKEELGMLWKTAQKLNTNNRLERTKAKFDRNRAHASA